MEERTASGDIENQQSEGGLAPPKARRPRTKSGSRRPRVASVGGPVPAASRREQLATFYTAEGEEIVEEPEVDTTDIVVDLSKRLGWLFGANLAINLPLRLVFLRQAALPLGSPQHSLVQEVSGLRNEGWKHILATSAIIGVAEIATGLFAGAASMYFDSGHIPSVDEWHEHEKPSFYGLSRKQLSSVAGKLLAGVFFYPVFTVLPIMLATHSYPGGREFIHEMITNKGGFWNGLPLNLVKYSAIDLAPWLENKIYHYLGLVHDEDDEDEDWEDIPFFSMQHLEKYGLSLTSTILASLIFVPIDVLTTQMVVYPQQYPHGVLECFTKVWQAEGLKGLFRGFWAHLLSEQELLFI